MHTATRFHETKWTRIRRAWSSDPATARKGLREMCEDYWPPVYGFLRQTGKSRDQASELTQGFFAVVLERGFSPLNEEGQRFRSYLIGALEKFEIGERRKQSAKKRGAGTLQSFDGEEAERLYALVPPERLDPEQFAMRQWAMEVIRRANAATREDWLRKGKSDGDCKTWRARWEALGPFLERVPKDGEYVAIAAELGTDHGHVKVLVGRLKKLRRDLLVEELAGYVDGGEAQWEAERESLLAALG
jgi:RNA polymerase sigma-70 factor (ECF subfamily)